MWTNEDGRGSVVLKNDIFTNDKKEKLVIGKEYSVKYGQEIFKGILKMLGTNSLIIIFKALDKSKIFIIDSKDKCESALDIMCNTCVPKPKSVKLKPKKSDEDAIESVEMRDLKLELEVVKAALDDQQKMLIELQKELKNKNETIDKKDAKIHSLEETLGSSFRYSI